MNYRCIIAGLAIAAAVTVAGNVPKTSGVSSSRPVWEYAELRSETIGTNLVYLFETPEKYLREEGKTSDAWMKLYHDLGGTHANPTTTAMLNTIGRDGWELVTVQKVDSDTTYTFKRQVQ